MKKMTIEHFKSWNSSGKRPFFISKFPIKYTLNVNTILLPKIIYQGYGRSSTKPIVAHPSNGGSVPQMGSASANGFDPSYKGSAGEMMWQAQVWLPHGHARSLASRGVTFATTPF